ncbi:MAG: helix-turn-helix domain-containing protein [Bdellovibrionales bacterium]|nr:helix-turn-helix domain-containing protein [Bdellovibrionales bacterium]
MQKRHLGKIFGSVRFVYNQFLKINEELYADGIQKLSRTEMQEHLLIWKEAIDWLSDAKSILASCNSRSRCRPIRIVCRTR